MRVVGLLMTCWLALPPPASAVAPAAVSPAEVERAFAQAGLVDPGAGIRNKVRVAILPFATPVGQPDMEQYGAGAMDSLITGLKHVPHFVMLDRGRIEYVIKEQALAVTGLADPKATVPVGKLLQAQTLVVGSIQASGSGDAKQIVISANIVDVATGRILDTERIRGTLKGIFQMQQQLADRFVANQQATLTEEQRLRIQQTLRSTTNLTAYQHYLRGRKAFYLSSPAGAQEAIGWYEKAVAVDPHYALAHAGLADAWCVVFIFKGVMGGDMKAPWAAAYRSGLRALELNLDLPEALRSFGYVAGQEHIRAVKLIARSNELAPNDPLTLFYLWIGVSGTVEGMDPDHPYLKQALTLGPELTLARIMRVGALQRRQRIDEAIAEFREALQRHPQNTFVRSSLARLLAENNRVDEADKEATEALRMDAGDPIAHYAKAIIFNWRGQLAAAVRELEEVLRLAPNLKQAKEGLAQLRARMK